MIRRPAAQQPPVYLAHNLSGRRRTIRFVSMALTALCLGHAVPAQVFRGYDADGTLELSARTARRRQEIKRYYPDGTLHLIATYHRDRLDGEAREYYPSGVLKAVIPYERGKRDGMAKFFYDNGMLMAKIDYRNDRETGRARFYDTGGMLTQSLPRLRLHQRRNLSPSQETELPDSFSLDSLDTP